MPKALFVTFEYQSDEGPKVISMGGKPTIQAAKREFMRQMLDGFFPLPDGVEGPTNEEEFKQFAEAFDQSVKITRRDPHKPVPRMFFSPVER